MRQCTHVFNRYCRHCVTNISQCNGINRNRKKLNEINDDECSFLFLYERTCNTKVTTILFYIYRPSNMLSKEVKKYLLSKEGNMLDEVKN